MLNATRADALLEPATIGIEDRSLKVVASASGTTLAVEWPRGFSARTVAGLAELVAPDGAIVAREGELLPIIGGSGGRPFGVCSVNGTTDGPAC